VDVDLLAVSMAVWACLGGGSPGRRVVALLVALVDQHQSGNSHIKGSQISEAPILKAVWVKEGGSEGDNDWI